MSGFALFLEKRKKNHNLYIEVKGKKRDKMPLSGTLRELISIALLHGYRYMITVEHWIRDSFAICFIGRDTHMNFRASWQLH